MVSDEEIGPMPDGVRVIQVGREGVPSLVPEDLEALADALRTAAARPPGLLILTGAPGRGFGHGTDLRALRLEEGLGGGYLVPLQHAADAVFEALATFPAPTAALVQGAAIGASLTLALACDLRGAVDSDKTLLGHPAMGLGLLPELGGVPYMGRVVGPVRAAELLASGRRVTAAEALRFGLVDVVLGAEDGAAALSAWAGTSAGRRLVDRERPRRYPQGKTWGDLLLERTRLGRRWLFHRLRLRLRQVHLEEARIEVLLEGLLDALTRPATEAGRRARRRAAEVAAGEEARDALSHFTMREWAQRGRAAWGTPQEVAACVQGAWYREGVALLLEGARVDRLEGLLAASGMGPGPFSLMDRDGLAAVVPLVRAACERAPDPGSDPGVLAMLDALLERDLSGPQRFYGYGGKERRPDPTVYGVVERVREGVDPEVWEERRYEAARMRLLQAVVAEASRGTDERHPRWLWELTTVTVLEWKPSGGGPLRRADRAPGGLDVPDAPRFAYPPPEGGLFFPVWPLPPEGPAQPG